MDTETPTDTTADQEARNSAAADAPPVATRESAAVPDGAQTTSEKGGAALLVQGKSSDESPGGSMGTPLFIEGFYCCLYTVSPPEAFDAADCLHCYQNSLCLCNRAEAVSDLPNPQDQ